MSEPELSSSSNSDRETIRSLLEEARDLIKRLEGSSVRRLHVEAGGCEIEIERGFAPTEGGAGLVAPMPLAAAAPAADDSAATAGADGRPAIVAPLVGTFYRAGQPGAKPFVEEGDVVDEGQTVAIVEAMKLMNEVKADQSGKVAEIVVGDGDWVEFEQALMYLEPVGE